MAAQASAPPTQVQQKVKAEIKFTAELDEILKRITEIKNIAGVIFLRLGQIWILTSLDTYLNIDKPCARNQLFNFLSNITTISYTIC